MKDLKAIRGQNILRQLIAQGEHMQQDFKYAVSDAPKIARSISAFANCEGGRLLIGVKDNGVVAGVRNEEDIYVVELAAERYCFPPQKVDFKAYRIDGLHVIVATVQKAESLPVYAVEASGKRKAFFRVDDENIAAHPLMVRAWQCSADNRSAVFDPSGAVAAAARLLADDGMIDDFRRLALKLHVSALAAEDAVVRLVASGLAAFRYDGSKFILVPADE